MSARCQTCGAREQVERCAYCRASMPGFVRRKPQESVTEQLLRVLGEMPGVVAVSVPASEYTALSREMGAGRLLAITPGFGSVGLRLATPHGFVDVTLGTEMAVLRRSGPLFQGSPCIHPRQNAVAVVV